MKEFFKKLFTLYENKPDDSYLAKARNWLYNAVIGSLKAVGYFLHACTGNKDSLKKAWNNLVEGPLVFFKIYGLVSPYEVTKTENGERAGEEKTAEGKEIQSALGQVPKILDYMKVSKADQDAVVDISKRSQSKGKFFGEIAVDLGIIKQEALDKSLGEQDILKVQAANQDMQRIAAGKKVIFPAWMKPHWGNNGKVNDVSNPITKAVAASAAANAAQLIVILVGNNPELARAHEKSVKTLACITEGILAEKPGHVFQELMKQPEYPLDQATHSIMALASKKDQDLAREYVDNRFQEVAAVLDPLRDQARTQAEGQARSK